MLNVLAAIHGTGVAASTTSYESISTVNVSTPVSSITFSSIPSTYKHLQIRVSEQTTANGSWRSLLFNGDTGLNTTFHTLYGTGSSAGAAITYSTGTNNWVYYDDVTGTSALSMSGYVIDLLDYQNTNKYKVSRLFGGHDNNGSGWVFLTSKLWTNTAAISSLTLDAGGSTFVANSKFALYGIKG